MSDSVQYPWDLPTTPAVAPAAESEETKPRPRGRRPAALTRIAMLTRRTAPDWLYHHLTVSGPADGVAAFAAAARGAGVTPWHLDGTAIEDDVFNLAIAQPAARRNLTVEGCRILARQFRERVEMRQAKAAALVGHAQACPFDLHALLPVPEAILMRGPTHPDALVWLARHWGTTDKLRQVVVRANATAGRRLPRDYAVIGYGFFTAGDTPQAAMDHCAKRWPGVGFSLAPRPAD